MFTILPSSIPSLYGKETLLFTSIAACYKLFPSCISTIKNWKVNPLWLGAGATIILFAKRRPKYTSICFISRWRLAFTFGARLAGVRFVERYIDDPDDATNALRILQTMVKTDKKIHRLVVELGGIETTIKAMKRYDEDNEGVASSGVGLIQAVCGYNIDTDRKLMNCGAIRAVVQAMRRWPNNEEVQASASKALDILASNSDMAIQKKIVDVGGLVTLAEARTIHQNDTRVTRPATHAILLLVTERKDISLSYTEPFVTWQSYI